MIVDIFVITLQNGKYYIAPLSAQNMGKYIIECEDEGTAQSVRQELISRQRPVPIQDSSSYEFASEFMGTKVYRPNPLSAPPPM